MHIDTYIDTWAERMELQDPGSRGHAARTAIYALALGQKLGLSSDQLAQLRWGMLLHDVGKLGVDNAIIRHPGKLTIDERMKVMQHPRLGAAWLEEQPELTQALSCVAFHHERWDGDGYNQGLKGIEIPLLGRIAAIVDAWDVMLTDRPYAPAMSVSQAVAELRRCSGTQFDPHLVDIFLSMSHRVVDIPAYVAAYPV